MESSSVAYPTAPSSSVETALAPMDDSALAVWLSSRKTKGRAVALFYAKTVCKVMETGDKERRLYAADPEKSSRRVFLEMAKKGLVELFEVSCSMELSRTAVAPSTWSPTTTQATTVAKILDVRTQQLGRAGRGPKLSKATYWRVYAEAGGRCMMEGCGEDLSHVPLHTGTAQIGYFAHIIASDPAGPRGDPEQSHKRSDDPENIMLMCDGHHRVIDCFAQHDYSPARLFAMREEHVRIVRQATEALRFPRALAITLLANLGNVLTDTTSGDLRKALLECERCMLPDVEDHIRRTQRDDRRDPIFWSYYLHEHEREIQHLVNSCRASPGAHEIAVFPLHHVPTTVLAGRILGEARLIRVFQYRRDRGTWVWDKGAEPHPPEDFVLTELNTDRADEVLVSLELTATVDEQALPAELVPRVASGEVPWVRLTTPNPSTAFIGHPEDLLRFKELARRAVNHVQDVMRARRVHLIGVSPASAIFSFGQLLQAGHHPPYTIYDRSDRNAEFTPAFTVTGHTVEPPTGTGGAPIKIR